MTSDKGILHLLIPNNKINENYDPKFFEPGEIISPQDYLNELINNQTKDKKLDLLTYLFGHIPKEIKICKSAGHVNFNKKTSEKYTTPQNMYQINLQEVYSKNERVNSLQVLFNRYFVNYKETIDFGGCSDTEVNKDHIQIGRYVLINIVNYDFITKKKINYKITPTNKQDMIDDTFKLIINGKNYYLRSIVCHQGTNLNAGHYVAYKNTNLDLSTDVENGWYYASDSTTREATSDEIYNYITNADSWKMNTPVIFMYELDQNNVSVTETVQPERKALFDTKNWKNQGLKKVGNKITGFINSQNGCFFNSVMQMIFSNRHLIKLILDI